jgi:hypothetical protein
VLVLAAGEDVVVALIDEMSSLARVGACGSLGTKTSATVRGRETPPFDAVWVALEAFEMGPVDEELEVASRLDVIAKSAAASSSFTIGSLSNGDCSEASDVRSDVAAPSVFQMGFTVPKVVENSKSWLSCADSGTFLHCLTVRGPGAGGLGSYVTQKGVSLTCKRSNMGT